ncbi:MAG: hypothetical protein ACOX6T_18315 [Myxococcales bacterium]|jgi:hypothetical protein
MSEQPSQPTQPTDSGAPSKPNVVPMRALVINLLFSMFTSLVIFAVASYYFLVPQILKQSNDLEVIKAQVQALEEQAVATDEAAHTDEPAPADEAQADRAPEGSGDTATPADEASAAAAQPAPAGEPTADEPAAAQEAPAQAAAAAP